MAEAHDNQHFVPQFYLRGFTIQGEKSLVWELDTVAAKYSKTPKSIRTICSRSKYYRQVRADGVEDADRMERGFAIEFEQKMAPLLRDLLLRIRRGEADATLSPDEWGQFCFLIGMQYARVPMFREKASLFYQIRGRQVAEGLIQRARGDGTLPPGVDEALRRSRLTVKVEDWGTIKPMIEVASDVSSALLGRSPGFLRPPAGTCLVTSDNPVCNYIQGGNELSIWEYEPIHPNAEVQFPLSQDAAVIIYPRPSENAMATAAIQIKCADLEARHVEAINAHAISSAERYVYSPMRLEELVEVCRRRNERRAQTRGSPGV